MNRTNIVTAIAALMLVASCDDQQIETSSQSLTWDEVTFEFCQNNPDECFEWMNENSKVTEGGEMEPGDFNDLVGPMDDPSVEKPPFGSLWIRHCRSCSDKDGPVCQRCCLTVYNWSTQYAGSYCSTLVMEGSAASCTGTPLTGVTCVGTTTQL
jgi:hypothetical protein